MGRSTVSSTKSCGDESTIVNTQSSFANESQVNDRILYLAGNVTEIMMTQLIANLIALANFNKTAPITLVVSTYGGLIDEMFSLYDMMNFIPCPVHTIGTGKIMSAGVLLLAAGKKGCRLIGKNARVMIHPATCGAGGNVFELLNEIKEHNRQQVQMERMLLENSKITKQQMENFMKSGFDNYFTAEEAVKLGIADQVIGSKI